MPSRYANTAEYITWGLSHSLAGVGETLPVDVTVIALGQDLAIVTLPGEVFVELGLAIKQGSPFRTTLVIELSNSVETIYIPNRAAYAGGSYEVTNSTTQAGPGEMLVEAALDLLREGGRGIRAPPRASRRNDTPGRGDLLSRRHVDRAVRTAEPEQAKNLALAQAHGAAGDVGENRVEQLALVAQDLIDPLFDRRERQKSGDGDRPGGADAMGPVDRLIFDRRIPPAIEQKDVAGELQDSGRPPLPRS